MGCELYRFQNAYSVSFFLKTNQRVRAYYAQRDTTGQWSDAHNVWLDADGTLVQAHPTDLKKGPIAAPETANYTCEIDEW
jgi:hypothetical protein